MTTITWLQGGSDPNNGTNFDLICQWWAQLTGKEVILAQRLIPSDGEVSNIDWQRQQFDEQLVLFQSEIRGITLYWKKSFSEEERSFTPYKLVLDTINEKLYIYPQSQRQVVIQVRIPNIDYTTVSLQNPSLIVTEEGEEQILVIRDPQRQIAVKIPLTPEILQQLKDL